MLRIKTLRTILDRKGSGLSDFFLRKCKKLLIFYTEMIDFPWRASLVLLNFVFTNNKERSGCIE